MPRIIIKLFFVAKYAKRGVNPSNNFYKRGLVVMTKRAREVITNYRLANDARLALLDEIEDKKIRAENRAKVLGILYDLVDDSCPDQTNIVIESDSMREEVEKLVTKIGGTMERIGVSATWKISLP
jgi:hypothetical protein